MSFSLEMSLAFETLSFNQKGNVKSHEKKIKTVDRY